jgi:hypothetical protein
MAVLARMRKAFLGCMGTMIAGYLTERQRRSAGELNPLKSGREDACEVSYCCASLASEEFVAVGLFLVTSMLLEEYIGETWFKQARGMYLSHILHTLTALKKCSVLTVKVTIYA